jgi:hypothetical protein
MVVEHEDAPSGVNGHRPDVSEQIVGISFPTSDPKILLYGPALGFLPDARVRVGHDDYASAIRYGACPSASGF